MEDYWNPDNLPEVEEEPEEQQDLFSDLEPEEEPVVQKPKKKKKKMTFKRRLRRAIKKFIKLPTLTKILAGVAVLIVIVIIVLLLVLLPKSCKASDDPGKTAVDVSESPDIPVVEDTNPPSEPGTVATVTNAPTNIPIPTISQTVKPNERDAAIPYIRTRLVELGYMEMPETNDELYDTATVNAVKRFQYRNFSDNFKAWDGYIGTQTYEQLVSGSAIAFFMKSGDTDEKLYDGKYVTEMQEKLVKLGYMKSANGNYDRTTVDAVRSFQKANSLDADGVAGQATLKLIDTLANAMQDEVPTDDTAVITEPTESPETGTDAGE